MVNVGTPIVSMWLRVLGDIVFALGTLYLAVYVLRLLGRNRADETATVPATRANA